MRHLAIISTMLLVVLTCSPAIAVLTAYDYFDYPNNDLPLDGKSGGSGWLGNWVSTTSPFSHSGDDISLNSPAYPFTPVGDRLISTTTDQGGGQSVGVRQWEGITMNQDDNVLFFSYLSTKISEIADSTSGANIEVNIGTATTTSAMRVGNTSNNALFVTGSGAAAAVSTADDYLQEGVTYLIVAKIVSKAAANQDKIYATAYGPSDIVPLTEPSSWTVENTLQLNAHNDRARVWVGANAEGSIDELRLGYSWASVANPAAIPGDFDGMNGLDPNDYLILRNNMFTGTSYAQGDFNGSGLTDLNDFILFREAWNQMGVGAFPGTVVPEPATWALLLIGGVVGAIVCRSSRKA